MCVGCGLERMLTIGLARAAWRGMSWATHALLLGRSGMQVIEAAVVSSRVSAAFRQRAWRVSACVVSLLGGAEGLEVR